MGWLFSRMSLGDVALYASIIAVLTANFGGFLFGRSAELESAPLSCGNFSVSAFLSNSGNHRAILASLELTATDNSGRKNLALAKFIAREDDGDYQTLLPAGGRIYEISILPKHRLSLTEGLNFNRPDCAVSAIFSTIQDSSSKLEPFNIDEVCSCSEFAQSN
jgi:hypothetical protein